MHNHRLQAKSSPVWVGDSAQRDINGQLGRRANARGVCACLFAVMTLMTACSSSSPAPQDHPDEVATGYAGGENPGEGNGSSSVSDGFQLFADEADLLRDIPNVVTSETLANSGLQVAYTRVEQQSTIPALDIESQWDFMQTCLEQVAATPIVVIVDGIVEPLTKEDDVIYYIDGAPAASASRGTVVIIQVRAADFDGSIGRYGFNMRSIMGRYIWLANELQEGDYPFFCASSAAD